MELNFIINFLLLRRERKSFIGNFPEQCLFNAWTCGTTQLALLLEEGAASSSMYILPYIYLASLLIFFYFTVVDCQSELITLKTLPTPSCFSQDYHLSRVRQFYLVSHFCSYCFSFFIFILVDL